MLSGFLADIVNGLMAIPNLVALIGLSGVVVSETKLYFEHVKQIEMKKRNRRNSGGERLGLV